MRQLNKVSAAILLSALSSSVFAAQVYKDSTSSADIGGYFNINLQMSDGDNNLDNSNSRLHFDYNQQLTDGWKAEAFTEWKLNLVSNEDSVGLQQGGNSLTSSANDFNDTVNIRHGWISLGHEKWGSLSVGKQWSAFYDVAGITDHMLIWGGNASGAFNYGTDGGISGTGRAEKSLIYRNGWGKPDSEWGSIDIGLQYQAKSGTRVKIYECQTDPTMNCDNNLGDEVNSYKYDYSSGISLRYTTPWNVELGAAYNRSELDGNPSIAGFDKDHEDIWIVGATYGKASDKLYIAANYSEGENHEFDNNGEVYDSKGVEIYSTYSLNEQWKLMAAYNYLESNDDSNDYAGDYKLEYVGLGVQYYWTENFWIYTESRIESSKKAKDEDGNRPDDPDSIYALALRYNF